MIQLSNGHRGEVGGDIRGVGEVGGWQVGHQKCRGGGVGIRWRRTLRRRRHHRRWGAGERHRNSSARSTRSIIAEAKKSYQDRYRGAEQRLSVVC
jgi:hypothetical protein